jgi:hypothetical protein
LKPVSAPNRKRDGKQKRQQNKWQRKRPDVAPGRRHALELKKKLAFALRKRHNACLRKCCSVGRLRSAIELRKLAFGWNRKL